MVDLSDEVQVRERNLDLKRHAALRSNTIRTIMEHKNGRAFIFWLLSICNTNANPFNTNALSMAFRAGEMNIGQQILAEITTRETIDLYFLMLKEGTESDERHERRDH